MLPIIKKYAGLLLIGAIYLLTAIHSNGFHHPDEHYQIVELAGLKGGWNTGANLTWEYDAQIRPALQPMIALGATIVFNIKT
jgi:phosphatidylinositol glycan class B